MLERRTDLAMEARELCPKALPGVRSGEDSREGWPLSWVEVLDGEGAAALGKPVGRYVTLDLTGYWRRPEGFFQRAVQGLGAELRAMLPEEGCVLVAGLGNASMTPDAIGPQTVTHLLITRHLGEVLPGFRPVAAAAAGVLGTTGIEAAEWVRALAERIGPAAVIVVDALAARRLSRVCATVQLSDTGIIPGSGVGNRRMALDRDTLGVPVISLGVPTVVDAATLALDLLQDSGIEAPADLGGGSLFVTPKDVDAKVRDLSKVLGYAIDLALQEGLTVADVDALLS